MNVNFLLNCFVQKRFYSLPWETIAELLQLFCMNGADDDGAIFQSIKYPSKCTLWKENLLELHNEYQFFLLCKKLYSLGDNCSTYTIVLHE